MAPAARNKSNSKHIQIHKYSRTNKETEHLHTHTDWYRHTQYIYKSKLNTYETFAIIELVFVAFFCVPKHERPTQAKKVPAVNTQFHCQRDERNYKLTGRNRKSYDDADYDDGSARQLCRCWRCQIGFTNCINY